MWSAVADVLTFYTERIANEAFLRTATQRDFGASPRPGHRLPARARAPRRRRPLAFTLERGAAALIPARTRMQSVPGEGETAQKYETLEPLAAQAALNRLRLFPAPASRPAPAAGSTSETAAPDAAAVEGVAALAPGKAVILYNATAVEVLAVQSVTGIGGPPYRHVARAHRRVGFLGGGIRDGPIDRRLRSRAHLPRLRRGRSAGRRGLGPDRSQ